MGEFVQPFLPARAVCRREASLRRAGMQRQTWIIAAILLLLAGLVAVPAQAIVVRDAQNDSLYRTLGSSTPYDSVGRFMGTTSQVRISGLGHARCAGMGPHRGPRGRQCQDALLHHRRANLPGRSQDRLSRLERRSLVRLRHRPRAPCQSGRQHQAGAPLHRFRRTEPGRYGRWFRQDGHRANPATRRATA